MRILCLDQLPVNLPDSIDAFELRLDLIDASLEHIKTWLETQHKPWILTHRHEHPACPKRLANFYSSIQMLRPTWVDCEHDVPLDWIQSLKQSLPPIKIIRSIHSEQPLMSIQSWINTLRPEADHVKIVTKVQHTTHLLSLLRALKDHHEVTILGTGPHGKTLRILGPKWGAFDYLGRYHPLHPHQLTLQDRLMHPVTAATRIRALLGHPAHHSLGPFWHGLYHRLTQQDAIYVTLEVGRDEVDVIQEPLVSLGFHQLSITSPHKMAIASWCQQPGPINTLSFNGTQWHGSNTDRTAIRLLTQHWPSQRILILGAGSIAQILAQELKHKHRCSFHYHRSDGIACKERLMGIKHTSNVHEHDCVINTMPRGTPLPKTSGMLYDVNYHTPGSMGLNVFALQALHQQQQWAEHDVMEAAGFEPASIIDYSSDLHA